jgi:asparagine synthase (glutamine-hydrolysing)
MRLGFPLLVRFVSREEALAAVQEVVRILRVFNPMEVVNCAAVYVALREAKLRGAKRACTGDGGDELCVGYSYMLKMLLEELKDYVRRLPQMWSFCAFKIGEALGLDVASPFLQNVELLLSIPVEEKVKCGIGKCLLRAELAEALGPEVAWRRKSPVERGSGFDAIYDVLAEMGKAVEADIPAEGAARYLYHIFKQLGYTYRRGAENPAPSAASSSAAATAPCAGGTDGNCQIPPRLRRLCGKNLLSAT